MYPPASFQTDNRADIQAFLQQHYFGLLLSHTPELCCTPLPFLFSWQQGDDKAYCHLARHNPQLQQLAGALVQIVIQGPHAFVPASCYPQQPAVSTWNYTMVQLSGKARLLDDAQTLALVRAQEQHSAPGMTQAPDYQQKLVKAIVGVEISLSKLSGRFKLSQNKASEQRLAVMKHLQQHEQPATVWQMMQQY